jgi:hypothetical protein
VSRLAATASSALAVTIVGSILAFVFGHAGQQVAREWQQTDRRLEVRTALARDLGETSAGFVGALRLRAIGTGDNALLDTSFRDWSVASSAIGGELGAYVKEPAVRRRWTNYRTNMTRVYYLFRASSPGLRAHWLRSISGYLAPLNAAGRYQVLDALLKAPPQQPDPVYERSLRELLDELQRRSDEIVADVIAAELTI